jgi:cyanophycinase
VSAATRDRPRIAVVLIDEGNGAEEIDRFTSLLSRAADCVAVPVLVPLGDDLDPRVLDDSDGIFVCGGFTPAYASAFTAAAWTIRQWFVDGHPYAGFSAGAAIAADRAIVGGWLQAGVPICHEDAAEDLDELTVVDGIGLVPFAVDVHCAQWGTLSRAVAAVESGMVSTAVGIDEDTAIRVAGGVMTVSGAGHAWVVTPSEARALVRTLSDGAQAALSR